MNKFECITVAILDGSDYVGEALNPAVAKDIDTVDMVIYENEVVKNRVHTSDTKPKGLPVKTFKGLPLDPEGTFQNIATLINAALLIDVVEQDDGSELSDCVLIIARQYAEAAHEAATESQK